LKALPSLANGQVVWQETISNQIRIDAVTLPALQPVFQNRNTVAVTPAMTSYAKNAFGLLSIWGGKGVSEITEFTSLTPQVAAQTAYLTNGVPAGVNFSLVSGTFVWVKFNSPQVLDLGAVSSAPVNLAAGVNVFGYSGYPDAYSAYQFIRQAGLGNVVAVRMLDAQSGRWRVAEVQGGGPVGEDFPIPRVAVLMVEMANPVAQFAPLSP